MATTRFNAGGKKVKDFTEEQRQEIKLKILCGCSTERFIHGTVGEKTKDLEAHVTARAMMQARINEYGGEDLPLPKRTNPSKGKPSETPNVFPDGSVKNPKEAAWRMGGAGAWWPGRKLEEAKPSETEERYIVYIQKEGGVMISTTFNSLMNSSTRCEMGAAIVALIKPRRTGTPGHR